MKTVEVIDQLKRKLGEVVQWQSTTFGQTTLEINKENLKSVLQFLKNAPEPGYEVLMDLTAVDYIVPKIRTKLIYWLHNPSNYERIRIILYLDRGEAVPSVSDLWQGAKWYERELFDMFGVHFEGHPDLKRILMPDDWVGHPMLRDYPLTEEPVQFKNEVKPKVPSEIIPYVRDRSKKS